MNIEITVANRIAAVVGSPVIVCGNKGYTVTFTFDREWDGYDEKTARFVFIVDGKAKFIDVLFSGNTCDAPMLSNISQVTVGVYAGDLRTTTGATIKCLKSILCGGGGTHEEPPEDVYNQILEEVSTKLSSSGGTLTGNFFLDGNEFIHEGNLYLLEPYLDNVLNGRNITETASGNAITIDSAKAPLQNLKLYGKTEQNGTPTPDAPVPLVSVGDSGSFEVGVFEKNLLEVTATTQTKNGVTFTINADKSVTVNGTATSQALLTVANVNVKKGDYVFSGYPSNTIIKGVEYYFRVVGGAWEVRVGEVVLTYKNDTTAQCLISITQGTTVNNLTFYPMLRKAEITDNTYEPCNKQLLTIPYTLRGVGGIKDEVDFIKGSYTENTYKRVFTGAEAFTLINGSPVGVCFGLTDTNIKIPSYSMLTGALCNRLNEKTSANLWNYDEQGFAISEVGQNLRLRIEGCTTTAELQAKLKEWYNGGNPLTIITERATPNEVALTETELNAYRHLLTNKGTTTILSEATADVVYYPNNECAQAVGNVHSEMRSMMNELTQAIISIGGAE